jgi:hypothetical protein
LDEVLIGYVKGHPRLGDKYIVSSSIMKLDREKAEVETLNTIYRLIGPELSL